MKSAEFGSGRKAMRCTSTLVIAFSILLAACGEAAPAPQTGTLRVAMQPIVQTDPAFISSDSEVIVASHVYDYLVDIDAENNVQPRLATDWAISEDGLEYVFQLADGVTFQDGTSLSADDVVWTFNRLRDPSLGLPTADLYSNIESIEATDDNEVTFRGFDRFG